MIKNIYKTSLSLLTDLYQLTMTYGYWKKGIHNNYASFNLFFRKNPFGSGYAVACGLENIINVLESFKFTKSDLDYIQTLKTDKGTNLFSKEFISFLSNIKFECDIEAVEEGRVVFANEPIIRVNGPIYQCQLIESAILNIFNFNSLIATKSARINHVSNGDPILEFGLRRAQGIDGALSASRSSYIGGTSKTSNVLAGKIYGIPVSGTHSHSWVMAFESELSSFKNYAEIMPDNTILLVDTFDTIEGVKNAIIVAKEMEKKDKKIIGVRIDSGDLAYLSKKIRKILDDNSLKYVKIIASNDIDEHILESLKLQGSKISVWGIGTRLVTAYDNPSLGAVYKLSAIKDSNGKWINKIKLSEQKIKINNPGVHQVRRFKNNSKFLGDMIYDINNTNLSNNMVDPNDSTKSKSFKNDIDYENLLIPIFKKGKCTYEKPSLNVIKERLKSDLSHLDESHKRLKNPHIYPVGLEKKLFDQKQSMIIKLRKN